MLLEDTIKTIKPLDRTIESAAQRRLDSLTKPQGSLGKLEGLARQIASIQGRVPLRIGPKMLFVVAADHGITEEGVSAYPKEVTAQMTWNFLRGGAAINVLARHYGVGVNVIDAGVDCDFGAVRGLRNCKIRRGTANLSRGPAMTHDDARQSIDTGIRLVQEIAAADLFLLGAGEMGIGNTTTAAAMLCALTGVFPGEVAGRGTGINDDTLEKKVSAIERGLLLNRPDPSDPVDVLAKIGGLEIGTLAGLMLGAAAFRIPMVLDGFISGIAALLACRLCPSVRDVLFASHLSAERGHGLALEELKLTPLLDLQMRLGEGTGACIVMHLIEAAARLMNEMETFESAGVGTRIP